MNLTGTVALITGGAQGLGRAISEKLLTDGAKVVVADIKTDVGEHFQSEMTEKYGENRIKFLKCDVRKSNQLLKTFQDAKSIFGSLDIVCNNAGIATENPNDARKIVDINLTAVLEGTYHAIELMSKKHGGNGGLVVNVASAAGLVITSGTPMYTATKQGVVGFTRVFKRENIFKDHGVRINCICPFHCETEMLTNALKIAPPEIVKRIKSLEFIKKEDVVDAFMMCVNDDKMNGEAVGVYPKHKIFKVNFPRLPQVKL